MMNLETIIELVFEVSMELVENICQNNLDIIEQIYENLFKKINDGFIDVFLCGGTNKSSIRNLLRTHLLSLHKNIRILYPEDLFIEFLNVNKEHNLLSLENFLAENCDIICIICESPGSLVELGAFSNNNKIVKKVVALVEKNKTKKKSFIMSGPVKYLKQMGKWHYSPYEKDKILELAIKLKTVFKNNKAEQQNFGIKTEITSIIGLYYFIQILLYFFTTISLIDLAGSLKYLWEKNHCELKMFDTTFRSALKLLKKERLVEQIFIDGKKILKLTKRGYKTIIDNLNKVKILKRTLLQDRIRFDIMNRKYYHYLS